MQCHPDTKKLQKPISQLTDNQHRTTPSHGS